MACEKLAAAGLDVVVPALSEVRDWISTTICTELVQGRVRDDVSRRFHEIIAELSAQGCEGVILGCTELTLLDLAGVNTPLFDTARIHVDAALDFALA